MSLQPFLIQFNQHGSKSEGYLTVAQNEDIPFKVERVYWVYLVPENKVRGLHAHKNVEEVLVAVHGEVIVTLESEKGEVFEFALNNPNVGLFVPRMYWITLKYSTNAILNSMTSKAFDEQDYIREYENFISNKKC